MADLAISASFSQQKTGSNQTPTAANPKQLNVNQVGDKVIKDTITVLGTDISLDLGSIVNVGWCWFQNLLNSGPPPSPVMGGIGQGGTPGSTVYTYVVVANFPDGSKSVSAATQTVTGAAVLNATNYNILSWPSVGATTYDIYRTSSGGTPATLGKIASTAGLTYNDQGAAGDGAAIPAVINSNFPIGIGIVSGTYPTKVEAGDYWPVKWNAAAIHVKALGPPINLTNFQYIVAEA